MRITEPVDLAGNGYPFRRYRCLHSDELGIRCRLRQGALSGGTAPLNRSAPRRVTLRRKTNRIVICREPEAVWGEFAFYSKQLQVGDPLAMRLVLLAIAYRHGRSERVWDMPEHLVTKTPGGAVGIGEVPQLALGADDVMRRRRRGGEGGGPVHNTPSKWILVMLRENAAIAFNRCQRSNDTAL